MKDLSENQGGNFDVFQRYAAGGHVPSPLNRKRFCENEEAKGEWVCPLTQSRMRALDLRKAKVTCMCITVEENGGRGGGRVIQ